MQAHPVLHGELRVRLGYMHPVNVFIHVAGIHMCVLGRQSSIRMHLSKKPES